ncbi:MAG: nucleotidyl transferase AbiEii/AbiGii toxin family protein [Euryarchaeota archaeon]|nr:nucleotidyl transferase AbiEii/AbiGii toxin family protein [Euryarchaeota archaeon]
MVTKAEIVSIARKQKLPLGMIEKDFVLTLVLREIYNSRFKNTLVFKGGTALHKLYLHKRLSVDLDFTALDEFDIDVFRNILLIKEINSEIRKIRAFENSVSIDLKYISLLNYPDSIKIDISLREKPLLELKEVEVHSSYFPDFPVLTFQIAESASEKMRALIQRKRPRDYLDMWLLLKELEFKDFEKLAEKKLTDMNDNMDVGEVFADLDIVRSLWKVDLEQLIPELPDFDAVMNDLKRKLE